MGVNRLNVVTILRNDSGYLVTFDRDETLNLYSITPTRARLIQALAQENSAQEDQRVFIGDHSLSIHYLVF